MHINITQQRHMTMKILKWMAKTHYKIDVIKKPSKHAQRDLVNLFNTNPVHIVFFITNPKQTFNFLENELQFGELINHTPFHRSDITYQNIDIDSTNNYHQTITSWSQPYRYVAILISLELKLFYKTTSFIPRGLSYQGEFINGLQQR